MTHLVGYLGHTADTDDHRTSTGPGMHHTLCGQRLVLILPHIARTVCHRHCTRTNRQVVPCNQHKLSGQRWARCQHHTRHTQPRWQTRKHPLLPHRTHTLFDRQEAADQRHMQCTTHRQCSRDWCREQGTSRIQIDRRSAARLVGNGHTDCRLSCSYPRHSPCTRAWLRPVACQLCIGHTQPR